MPKTPKANSSIKEKIDLDCDGLTNSILTMSSPKDLVENGYTIMNERTKEFKCRGKVYPAKSPVNSDGIGMKKWESMPHDAIVAQSNYDEPYTLGFGIRLGEQKNGKLILSLDFDCCKKIDGEYVDCFETIGLLNDYQELVGDEEGMFSSSTEGNKNVLIDYTNSPKLKEIVEGVGKNNICKDTCGLEILIYGNQVIPPTQTICKKNGCDGNPREYLTDVVFKIVEDDDPIVQYISDYINSCDKPKKKKTSRVVGKKKLVVETYEEVEEDERNELLDMISIESWDDFHSWKKIIWAMKKENYSRENAIKYSRKSDKYDKEGFDNIWDNAPEVITLTQGTINHYAKKGNLKAYNKYIHKKIIDNGKVEFIKNKTDKGFAEVAIDLMDDDIIFIDEQNLYIYDEKKRIWKNSEGYIKYVFQKRIIDLCSTYQEKIFKQQQEYLNEINDLPQEEQPSDEFRNQILKGFADEIKLANDAIRSISNSSKTASVLTQLKVSLMDRQESVDFDAKTPHIFCFKNIAFDLNTGDEYDIQKEDYITQTTGYDYEAPTDEAVDLIKKIFEDIFISVKFIL